MSDKRRPSKRARILAVFFGGRTLHRFQAERIGDHALHSTVSDLSNHHGLTFDRKRIKVPTRFGGPTSVVQYRLADCSRGNAAKLLEKWGVSDV